MNDSDGGKVITEESECKGWFEDDETRERNNALMKQQHHMLRLMATGELMWMPGTVPSPNRQRAQHKKRPPKQHGRNKKR